MYLLLPFSSEFIEVLWIVNDRQMFWWMVIVLEINAIRMGRKIAKACMPYDPGPGVPNHSDYSVFSYCDMTIADSKHSPPQTSSRNIRRNFEEG